MYTRAFYLMEKRWQLRVLRWVVGKERGSFKQRLISLVASIIAISCRLLAIAFSMVSGCWSLSLFLTKPWNITFTVSSICLKYLLIIINLQLLIKRQNTKMGRGTTSQVTVKLIKALDMIKKKWNREHYLGKSGVQLRTNNLRPQGLGMPRRLIFNLQNGVRPNGLTWMRKWN